METRYPDKYPKTYAIKMFIYNCVRRYFWISYNPNEDFACMQCGKPVFKRLLTCSAKCWEEFEDEILEGDPK
jgi:hypothetical protein